MKNLLESVAILFVGLLSLAIVFLIVQYSLIEDDSIEDEINFAAAQMKVTQKETPSDYLSKLEGYGDDVDVKVDATIENTVNTVVVKSELKNDDLSAVVDDKSKKSYMENLEDYSDEVKKEKLVKPKKTEVSKPVPDNLGEPEKLEQEEIVDEIGMAIDAALDDL